MTMTTIYTVSKASLIREATMIETYANDSLQAWILLGQSERYSDEMKKARAIRGAAEYKSPATRREIMRDIGYTIAKI
jgi:hypothetical protein